MHTIIIPEMSVETYNKIRQSIEECNPELFLKLVVGFYDDLNKIDSNWVMPSTLELATDWYYLEKEYCIYNEDLNLGTTHHWVRDLYKVTGKHIYFSTDLCIKMIKSAETYYSYKGMVYKFAYKSYESGTYYCPMLIRYLDLNKIKEIK